MDYTKHENTLQTQTSIPHQNERKSSKCDTTLHEILLNPKRKWGLGCIVVKALRY